MFRLVYPLSPHRVVLYICQFLFQKIVAENFLCLVAVLPKLIMPHFWINDGVELKTVQHPLPPAFGLLLYGGYNLAAGKLLEITQNV